MRWWGLARLPHLPVVSRRGPQRFAKRRLRPPSLAHTVPSQRTPSLCDTRRSPLHCIPCCLRLVSSRRHPPPFFACVYNPRALSHRLDASSTNPNTTTQRPPSRIPRPVPTSQPSPLAPFPSVPSLPLPPSPTNGAVAPLPLLARACEAHPTVVAVDGAPVQLSLSSLSSVSSRLAQASSAFSSLLRSFSTPSRPIP